MTVATDDQPMFPIRQSPPSRRLWLVMLLLWLISAASTGSLVSIGRALHAEERLADRDEQHSGEKFDYRDLFQSSHATLLGVSLTKWSTLFLLLSLPILIASGFGGFDTRSPPSALLLPVILAIGVGSALWLVPIQLFQLHASCPPCLILHAANVGFFICALVYAHQSWLHKQYQRWLAGELPLPRWPRILQLIGMTVLLIGQVVALVYFAAPPASLPVPVFTPPRQLEVAEVSDLTFLELLIGATGAEEAFAPTSIGPQDATHQLVVFVCLTDRESGRLYRVLKDLVEKRERSLRIDFRFNPQWPGCNDNYRNATFDESHRDACAVARIALAVATADPQEFAQFLDWAFSHQDQLTESAALAEAGKLVGEEPLQKALDSTPVWHRAAEDIRLAQRTHDMQLPAIYCERGKVYGGVDASALQVFLQRELGGTISNELPQSDQPVWVGLERIESHARSGVNLARRGLHAEAVIELQKALRVKPRWPQVSGQLAWLLATSPQDSVRDGTQAVYYARRALNDAEDEAQVKGKLRAPTIYHEILAAAYAEHGEFEQAIKASGVAVDRYLADRDKPAALKAEERRKTLRRDEGIRSTELMP